MKKIILFTFIAVSTTITFGQRKVDIAVTQTSPTASTIIRTGVPFNAIVKITNNGPDVLKSTDTLIYLMGIGNVAYTNTAVLVPLTTNIAVGNSATFTFNNLITGGAGGPMQVCAYVVLNNRALPDTVKDNVLGGNNQSCASLKYSGTGIGKIQVGNSQNTIAYPNPASTNITIAFNAVSEESVTIEIYDMQGRMVQAINNGLTQIGENSVLVDLTNMNKGIYFYKVISGNNNAMNKFIIE